MPTNKVESVVFDERMSSNSATSQPVARVFNKFHRAELSEIFKKIGSKEKTKEVQGLVSLSFGRFIYCKRNFRNY